jgi:hypothetical protein
LSDGRGWTYLADGFTDELIRTLSSFDGLGHAPAPVGLNGRVSLPLIRSSRPGSLHSLTNAKIDDILG